MNCHERVKIKKKYKNIFPSSIIIVLKVKPVLFSVTDQVF